MIRRFTPVQGLFKVGLMISVKSSIDNRKQTAYLKIADSIFPGRRSDILCLWDISHKKRLALNE